MSLKVKDLPEELREALTEREFDPDQPIDPIDAVGEWTAWHLGDRYWGTRAIRLYLDACATRDGR